MAIKPFEFLANAVRAKEIATVLARNGFADLLQKLDLPPRLLGAFGKSPAPKRNQWERIRIVMEELGPTFIKIGQMLSMRPDVIPEGLMLELQRLQENVPSVPFATIRPSIEEAIGLPLEEVFARIDEQASAGASMAQVHFAELKGSGERVAVKVQRPNLEKIVDADFDILSWFARQAHERIEELRPYNLPGVLDALREGLERELDFRREAKSLAYFAATNAHPEEVVAPRVHDAFCSRRVLVMEWIDGRRLEEVERDSALALKVAARGSRSLFQQILIHGYFHADPHGGNIRLLDDGRICLLDWGLTGQLTRRMRYGLVDLFLGFVRGDVEKVTRLAISLADSGTSIDRRKMERDVMLALSEHYNPETGEGEIGRSVLKLLYVFGRNGVDLARDYSLMAKAILCVEEFGRKLDSNYNVRSEFEPALKKLIRERRDPARLARELGESAFAGVEHLRSIPEELLHVLKKVEKDNLNVNLNHRGLEDLDESINDASNKITLGIIIGCLLVGSSLVVTSNIPPLVFGISVLGWFGYLLSFFLGVYVAFDIIRGPKK